jgi:hypothetical protein
MSTCTPNLRHAFLTIWEIITFKIEEKVFFPYAQGGLQCFGGQKTTFSSRFGMTFFRFLSLSEIGTCSQNFMPTRGVEP